MWGWLKIIGGIIWRVISAVGSGVKSFLVWIGVWDWLVDAAKWVWKSIKNLWNIFVDFLAWFDQNFEALFENAFIAVGKAAVQFVNLIISGVNNILEALYAVWNVYNRLAGNPLAVAPSFAKLAEPQYRELTPFINSPDFNRDFNTYWDDTPQPTTVINFNGNVYDRDNIVDLINQVTANPNFTPRQAGAP